MSLLWGCSTTSLSGTSASFILLVSDGTVNQETPPPPDSPTSNIGEPFKCSFRVRVLLEGWGHRYECLTRKVLLPCEIAGCKSNGKHSLSLPIEKLALRKEEVRDGERRAFLSPLHDSLDPTIPEGSRPAFGFPSHMNH